MYSKKPSIIADFSVSYTFEIVSILLHEAIASKIIDIEFRQPKQKQESLDCDHSRAEERYQIFQMMYSYHFSLLFRIWHLKLLYWTLVSPLQVTEHRMYLKHTTQYMYISSLYIRHTIKSLELEESHLGAPPNGLVPCYVVV